MSMNFIKYTAMVTSVNARAREMTTQQGFTFDDPDSRTRSSTLNVVYAQAKSVSAFDRSLFADFDSMKALTYTSSIPMILGLLKDFDYAEFECIFGHNGVLSRSAADLLSFQSVMDEKLNEGFVGINDISEERRKILYDRAASGAAQFYVVKDAIAHAKIYLLEREDLRRVIVGSANLSETAFSGRQAETLIVFDNDDMAWRHYSRQYEAVRSIASSRIPLREKPIPAQVMPIEETPALKDTEASETGISLYIPAQIADEEEYSTPQILNKVEHIKPIYQKAMADIKPDRQGVVSFTSNIVKQMTRIATSVGADDAPSTYLSYDGQRFILSDDDVSMETEPDEVRSDVEAWIEFFSNYENGFVGDVPRLQKDYFTFMSWFYFAPLMCDVRNSAIRTDAFSFDQPMFAVVYGQSNCGKSSLIETLMKSMFSYPRIVETQYFTRSNLRGLQHAYKRFPVVFDDVTRDRFNRHAPEIIKEPATSLPAGAEYPCFALSMNADARSFQPEIVKRCLMIYTRTALPGDDTAARRRLQRSVSSIRERLTTALYRHYMQQVTSSMEAIPKSEYINLDVLELSSSTLHRIFKENLPDGAKVPDWCAPASLEEYQNRAFERPRLVLENLIHPDKYVKERRPPVGSWTISGDIVLIGVEPFSANRTKGDIPDWILDDTASVSDQIAMKRELLGDFLGKQIRRPRRWLVF